MKRLDKTGRRLHRLASRAGLFVAPYKKNRKYVERTATWELGARLSSRDPELFERFYRLAKRVIDDGRTLLDYERLYTLWMASVSMYRLGLAAAEVGMYRGGSTFFLASALKALSGSEPAVHGFDTFEGHPERTTESDTFHAPSMFSDADYEDVKDYLAPFEGLQLHKGVFPESAASVSSTEFGLVHVDVDLYQTTIDCLEFFGPRMPDGGIIVVDDFGADKCPGVKKAVETYLLRNAPFIVGRWQLEQLVLVKRTL